MESGRERLTSRLLELEQSIRDVYARIARQEDIERKTDLMLRDLWLLAGRKEAEVRTETPRSGHAGAFGRVTGSFPDKGRPGRWLSAIFSAGVSGSERPLPSPRLSVPPGLFDERLIPGATLLVGLGAFLREIEISPVPHNRDVWIRPLPVDRARSPNLRLTIDGRMHADQTDRVAGSVSVADPEIRAVALSPRKAERLFTRKATEEALKIGLEYPADATHLFALYFDDILAERDLRPARKPAEIRSPEAAFASCWDEGSIQRRRTLLARIEAAAGSADVQLQLYSGTLLGYVREGKVLDWDDDIDLALFGEDGLEGLLEALRAAGLETYRMPGHRDSLIKIFDPSYEFIPDGSGGHWPHTWPFADLWVFRKSGPAWVCRSGAQAGRGREFNESSIHPARRAEEFEGVRLWIPNDPSGVLDVMYADWRYVEETHGYNHRDERPISGKSSRLIRTEKGRKIPHLRPVCADPSGDRFTDSEASEQELLVRRVSEADDFLRQAQLKFRQNRSRNRFWEKTLCSVLSAHDDSSQPRKARRKDAGKSSSFVLGAEGLLLTRHKSKLKVVLSSARNAGSVWGRLFVFPARETVTIEVSFGRNSRTSRIREAAGMPAKPQEVIMRRRLRVVPGQAFRVLEFGPGKSEIRFRVRVEVKAPVLLQLDRGEAGPEEAALPRSMLPNLAPEPGRILLQAHELVTIGRRREARLYAEIHAGKKERRALPILRANDALDDDAQWLRQVNSYLETFGNSPVELRNGEASRFLRLSASVARRVEAGPTVSVIMCAYNAEDTLLHAAGSILNQTWRPIELIIVDDASTDSTPRITRELAGRDPRVKIVRNRVNLGADVSRNPAVAQVTGDYITCHDADDWAHPERIERHVSALLKHKGEIRAGRVGMLRVTHAGKFQRLYELSHLSPDGALRMSFVSCMFETSFFRECLGYWDSVNQGGDSEMISRARSILGDGYADFSQFGLFALDSPQSVSHHPIYGSKSSVGMSPTSQRYLKNARTWHQSLTPDNARLPFPHSYPNRLFPAPAALVVPEHRIRRAMSLRGDEGGRRSAIQLRRECLLE